MTSDAKIGLLLGLVFIFIIAFIINGLPSFHKDSNNNELTTNMTSSQNNPPGIGAKERKVSREVINPKIRYIGPLPKPAPVVKESKKTIEIKPTFQPAPKPVITKKTKVAKPRPVKPPRPKIYVVAAGDSLAVIAQKFYGPVQGNKRTNINRIFQANRKLLTSPDEIYVGQKLTIPPLSASPPDKNKIESTSADTIFKKVASIGKRHIPKLRSQAKQSGWYVVAEGDSIWEIAAEQLGDGSRYDEIVELNSDILDDEDTLSVGMRLKMPTR
jgi:nucleoid-associated protein YgaU